MKISNTVLFLACATATSASTIRSANAKAALLSMARLLDDAAGDDGQTDYSFLANYKLKLIACANSEQYTNPENGETEYGSVVFRLCPADSCDDDSATGCKDGYGDYIVGLNTFVQSWLQDKAEDMQQDDAFKVEDFGECREYKADNDDGNEAVYYVGPACSDSAIKLGFFSDDACTTVPEGVTFEDISNGWTLPYSTGGLVTGSCESCAGYNDNGELEVAEMCTKLWESSGKCEDKFEYSKDTTNCEVIQSFMPASKGAGAAVGWVVFALIVMGVGAYGYAKWWTSKKRRSGAASGGVLN